MTTWPGWSNDNTLVLPLDDAPPGEALEFDGRRFDAKKELHVTLVGRKLGGELRSALGDRLDIATRPAFEALDWSYVRTGQRRLIERPDTGDDGARSTVASVIELVELPALDWYYRWLGELLGRQLPVPPAHVTLYTHRKAKGIGIPTVHSLRAWSRGAVPATA
ncbi:hypothetical protein [Lysobacter sp. HA18]